ncbi:MAG TPA: hypothetical protein VK207_01345 [Bacteroidales bacterium]|nr:hypothetical protein [Bacteroidales bacterium]
MKGSMKFILFVGTISLALTQQANQKQIVESGFIQSDTLVKEKPDHTAVNVDTMPEKIEDIKYDRFAAIADMPDFPTLNPMVDHFAISLILFAAILQLLNVFLFKKDLAWIVFLFILAGFIAAIFASRNFHPYTSGLAERAAVVMGVHEKMAEWTIRTALLALILQVIHLFLTRFDNVFKAVSATRQRLHYRSNRIFMAAIALILLTSSICVYSAGHLGAQLVHVEGIGFQEHYRQ